MKIRESVVADQDQIYAVHLAAFGEQEGPVVAGLASQLLVDESARPVLSLVADDDGAIVGNVIFSAVTAGECPYTISIMCPLAVAAGHQGKGLGQQLIQQGLERLAADGTDIVLVLGDPKYYSRAGFKAGHKLQPPYELPYPEAWMARALQPDAEEVWAGAQGIVQCAQCLQDPKYW